MKLLMVLMASAFFVFALSACGGGGGGDDAVVVPPPSTESFALTQAIDNYINETSSALFSISGSAAGEPVTGSGILSIGSVSSGIFEGVSALVKTSTVTGSISVAGQSEPYAGTLLTYFDSNYVYLGEELVGDYYSVATMVNSIPDFVKIGDTGVWYLSNNYSDISKTFLLTTSTVSYVVEPDTASTAILKIINTESDGYFEVVSFRMTVNGSLTRISESGTDPAEQISLVVTYQ